MRYNVQNYKFFKSYRFPITKEDKVEAEVITFERENIKTNKVQIDSVNLSGLNFICNQKYSIGELVKVQIGTNRIFNNWDFELTGRIIRSFIYCKDVTKTIYGISISPDSQTEVLKYFLKDFLSHYKSKKLKDKLFQICQNKIKISKDDGVELFSLFQSLIQRSLKGNLNSILTELSMIFHCENYHILQYNPTNKDFEIDHTNSDYNPINKTFTGLLNEAYFNKVIINKSFGDHSATGINVDIKNVLLAPIINFNGESIGVLCLSNTLSGDKFNLTMLENIKIVSGLISYFYSTKEISSLERVKNQLPNHFIFADRTVTGLSIINTLNTIKNTRENLYIHGEDHLGKREYAKYVAQENSMTVDFKDDVNKGFEFIEDVSSKGISDLIVESIEELSLDKQAILYNLISSLRIRIITISSIDLKTLEQNDLILTDLYNHITTVKLNIPPLRHRRAEIVEIAKHYIQFECRKRGMETKRISQESINKLEAAKWDMNNEQLHALIVKAILMLDKKTDQDEQVLQIPIKERQSDTILTSDKNTQLQKYILNTINSCDKSISYNKTEKVFVESLMTKKAS